MFVARWLAENQNCKIYGYETTNVFVPYIPKFNVEKNNIVVHTHTRWLPIDPSNWRFIHVCRQQVFYQAVSMIVAHYTKQSMIYTNETFDPVEVHVNTFDDCIEEINSANHMFELQSSAHDWKQAYKIYFEDFIENADYLNILKYTDKKISYPYTQLINNKNTRQYNQIIKNYYELVDHYKNKYFHV